MINTGLHGRLVDDLGRMIVSDQIAAEDFPSAEQIAQNFGVSRSVVREACRVLEAKGLITSKPRVGVRLAPASQWHYLDSDVVRWRAAGDRSAQQLQELAEVRRSIEPLAAYLASEAGGGEYGAQLDEAMARMRRASEKNSYRAFVRADRAFHSGVLLASGNRMIGALAETVSVALQVRSEVVDMGEDMSNDALDLHEGLLRAILDSRPKDAEYAAHTIVETSLREVAHALNRANGISVDK